MDIGPKLGEVSPQQEDGELMSRVTCHVSRVTTVAECDEAPGFIAHILTIISLLLICVTFPLSLCWVVKVRPRVTCHVSPVTRVQVVQEYERAVVFRLGRMLTGKARGPGVFFVIPCIDMYEKIDLRTQTYDVPPQEVRHGLLHLRYSVIVLRS